MSDEARKPRKRLGEILVSLGFVTSRQMQENLQKQAQARQEKGYARRLGHFLIDEGLIREDQLATALAAQGETFAIDLCGYEINLQSLTRIPKDVVSAHCFVPLGLVDGVLHVALDDMPEPGLEDGLKAALRCPIHFVMAPTSQVSRVRSYAGSLLGRGSTHLLTRTVFEKAFFEGDGGEGVRVLGKPKAASAEDPTGGDESGDALEAVAPAVPLAPPPDVTEVPMPEGLAFGGPPDPEASDPLDQMVQASGKAPTSPGLPPSGPPPPAEAGKRPTNPRIPVTAGTGAGEGAAVATARRSAEFTRPPLSRVTTPLSVPLEAILAELLRSECHSLSVCPHRRDADLVVAHEDGAKVLRTLSMAEYHQVVGSVEKLLGVTASDVTAPLREKVELQLQGAPLTVRVWILPSRPPTISFSAVDREAWSSRRRIHLDAPLVEALTRRGAQRRGLIVLAAADASDRDDALAGILAQMKRRQLRVAVFTDRSVHRLREVAYHDVRDGDHVLSQEHLLYVTESGLDVLAFNLPLTPRKIEELLPLAAVEATVILCLEQKDALEAVRQLTLTTQPPPIVSATLGMAVAVHRARRLCPFCRRPVVLTEERMPAPLRGSKLVGSVAFQSPGCALCVQQGHRGMVHLHETLSWDHEKAGPAVLALDRRSMQKKLHELGLMRPLSLEAKNAMLQGVIGFDEYLRLIGLTPPA